MIWALFLALSLFLAGRPAAAHESLPASLLISERAPGVFDVDWRIPATQGVVLNVEPVLPTDCTQLTAPKLVDTPAALRQVWSVQCAGGLARGEAIAFNDLGATMFNVLVRIAYRDGHRFSAVASPRSPVVRLDQPQTAHKVQAGGYFGLGVEHILTGYDHLLFVLCLILLVPDRWRLLKTITAFTLAHSITLAAAALGYVHVPGPPIEANIALSIAFLARELTQPPDQRGLSARIPWAAAFCFGLLHGLGFAGALAEVGLPDGEIPLALFLFNLGVEAGQVLFVGAVLSLVWLLTALCRSWPSWSERAVAYSVGAVSTFWLVQRLLVIAAPH